VLLGTPSARDSRRGGAVLVALCLAGLPACKQSQPSAGAPKQVVGEFVGQVDGWTGTMTISAVPKGTSARYAFGVIPSPQDGVEGSGAFETVELATVTSSIASTDLAGVNVNGGCGRRGSFCADVTLRSFYRNAELHNVYVEITSMTPSTGNLGFWNTAAPSGTEPGSGEVAATYGLWAYPTLLDFTRGTVGGTMNTVTFPAGATPGANAARRRWAFDSYYNTNFTFVGRVMADVVATTNTTDLNATCGATQTSLASATDCGECGRACNGACTYVNSPGALQKDAVLSFQCGCAGGQTACDSGDAMALACTDLQSDVHNCGACGNDCGTGTCSSGSCQAAPQCAVGTTACGASQCCPAGSTCITGACILSDATEVAVGADHVCAATNTARLPAPFAFVQDFTPSYPNNVVCWGNSWITRVGSPIWPRGIAMPEYYEPGGGDHSLALWPDMYGLSSGGRQTVALTPHASGHPVAAYFWGDRWQFVESSGTLSWKLTWGGAHGCGIGNIATARPEFVLCWGDNTVGQLGSGNTTNYGFPNLELPGLGHTKAEVPQTTFLTATDISAGGKTTCAVLAAANLTFPEFGPGQTAGTVACWGDNTHGEAGGPLTVANYLSPHVVTVTENGEPLTGVVAVSVGAHHAVALLDNGDLAFWGLNDDREFGAPSATGALVTEVVPAGAVTSFSAGQDFTCYVAGGKVYCSGKNDLGQLGNGTAAPTLTPTEVLGVSGATKVSAGGVPAIGDPAHGGACALAGGYVYCWGDNSSSQLGIGGGASFYTVPQLVQLAPVPAQ